MLGHIWIESMFRSNWMNPLSPFAFRESTHARFNVFIFEYIKGRRGKNGRNNWFCQFFYYHPHHYATDSIRYTNEKRSGIEIDLSRTFGSLAIYHWPNKIRIWPIECDSSFQHSIYIPDQFPRHIVNFFLSILHLWPSECERHTRCEGRDIRQKVSQFIQINVNHSKWCVLANALEESKSLWYDGARLST